MKKNSRVMIIIPARGGSKGIPRKNLRSLSGKPLLYYSIRTALASKYQPEVYVSTDDPEISAVSSRLGAKVIQRDVLYARDDTTLDPVIYAGYLNVVDSTNNTYDLVVTLQPTSPLLKTSSLDAAIDMIVDDPEIDTVISAVEDTHLSWIRKDGRYVPNYKKRVNRQYLDPVFKETGGFLITRSSLIAENNRIGNVVALYLLEKGENIDIDTDENWAMCEFYLTRKKILFVISGNNQIGLGHVYNALIVANDLIKHQLEFLVDKTSQLAFDQISSKNYPVRMQVNDDIVNDIGLIAPDIVINDRLDTTVEYVTSIKNLGIKVINFEDLGVGARHADLVINAIYPEKMVLPKHYFGHDYFILRDEFLLVPPKSEISEVVSNVLLTFGGVDPNNISQKVIAAIYEYCIAHNIQLSVITGFGYSKHETLRRYENVTVHHNSSTIANEISAADVVFTSAGRTVYEVAALHVPTIVLAQNARELTHFFASSDYGFINLGLCSDITENEILLTFISLVENLTLRRHMSNLMAKCNLSDGRKRVLKLIKDLME